MVIKAKTKIGIADILVCVIAVIIAAVLLLCPASSSGSSVYVKTDSDELSLDLNKDCTKELRSNGHTLTVEIKDGGVRILNSDCPDGLCVSTGTVTDRSKVIVCAPAKVLIRITDDGGSTDADIIAGR